jgi:tRNA dimethylallyltransferase
MMEKQSRKLPLLAVVGPNASGKPGLAVELALALGGEIVSADSMQIYRHMQIGTAKPTPQETKGIVHHLIDFVAPANAAFSVADYARLAKATLRDIPARGKLPILAGGTGLYVNGWLTTSTIRRWKTTDLSEKNCRHWRLKKGTAICWTCCERAIHRSRQRVIPISLGGFCARWKCSG